MLEYSAWMLLALSAALLPIAAGVAFAFVPGAGRGLMGPARSFALAAALAVVLGSLLPSSLSSLGPIAAVVFVGGLAGPVVAERIAGRVASRAGDRELGLELAFVGLVAHQIVDGVEIGAAAIAGERSTAIAIAVHTAPLVGAAVLGYAVHHGRAAALRRAAGLAVATALGVGFGHVAADGFLDGYEGWLQAALAGLLLHILVHDLDVSPPVGRTGRLAELVAAVAGFALPLAFAGEHGPAPWAGFSGLPGLWQADSPAWLVGMLAAYLVSRAGASREDAGAEAGGLLSGVVSGLLTPSRRVAGAEGAAVRGAHGVGLALSGPVVSLPALLLSLVIFGPVLAMVRWMGALALLGLVGGIVSRRTGPAEPSRAEPSRAEPSRADSPNAEIERDWTSREVPWFGAGVVAAAGLIVVGAPILDALAGPWGWFAAFAVALPGLPALVGLLPAAGVALDAGVPIGPVMLLLWLSPLIGVRRWRQLSSVGGPWRASSALVVAMLVASAMAARLPFASAPVRLDLLAPLSWVAAAVLLRDLWIRGLRGWVGAALDPAALEDARPGAHPH